MIQTPVKPPEATSSETTIENIAFDSLTIALANVSATVDNFQSPYRLTAHDDQIQFHQAEIDKLNRDINTVKNGHETIADRISEERATLKRAFDAADRLLADRATANKSLQEAATAAMRKSISAHNAALKVLAPTSSTDTDTFRAAGSQKVS